MTQTETTNLNLAEITKLKAPFAADVIGVKIQAFSKAKDAAMLVLYLQHTDVYDRLEAVDPAWSVEQVSQGNRPNPNPRSGEDPTTSYVVLKLTVKGVSRVNVGDGNDPKAAYSDALKRCAMLFGVGRYLYDSETVWVPYNEAADKFKKWSYKDYEAARSRFAR